MGSGTRKTTILEYLLVFYCIGAFVVGLGLIAVGMWMNIDLNVKAYMTVFRRYPEDELLVAATACFIVAGIILCAATACALIGLFKEISFLLLIFVIASFLILVMELTIAFLVVEFNHDIHRQIKDGMKEQLEYHYMWDNDVGHAWNRVQVRKKCCGADGSWDYYKSNWWLSENPGVDDPNDASANVPDSCCVLESNQDRDPSHVDPQDPRPKDERRCNEDAAGRKDGSGFLHGRGCFARMLDFVDDYYWAILSISLIVGLAQIFSIAIGLLVYRRVDEPETTGKM